MCCVRCKSQANTTEDLYDVLVVGETVKMCLACVEEWASEDILGPLHPRFDDDISTWEEDL